MSNHPHKTTAIIVGAGLGGLAAGLALSQKGIQVQLLEQASQLGEVGAGIQLSPNATRVLARLGILDTVQAISSEAQAKKIRLWNTGQTWPLFDLGAKALSEYGYPYLTVYRADLHKVMVDAMQQNQVNSIHLNAHIIKVEQTDTQVVATSKDGRTFQADFLVGADGVHSHVRNQLFESDTPQYSGLLAWRGVIPAKKLPQHLQQPHAVNWVGPGGHVIHYPLRRGELMNFVGIRERDDWTVESWTESGTIEECAADFPGWHADVHTLIQSLDTPFKWAMMLRKPMQQWTKGRITLLGDACHPTLPMLASGAAMAIEDGYILARCISEKQNITKALLRYQDLRTDRTARVVTGSAENARRFHNPELAHAEGAAAYVSREWSEEKIYQRYHWLFEYKADEIEI